MNAARGKECAIRSVRGDRDSVMVTVAAGGSTWLVQFLDVAGMRFELSHSRRVELTGKHILIDAAIGPDAVGTFKGEPDNVVRLHAELHQAHRAIAQDWIPLEDHWSGTPLPRLLARGGTATGPQRLIKAYAAILKRHGCEVKVKPQRGGRYRVGGRWVGKRPDLVALTIGSSYIIGRCNSVERIRT